MIRRFGLLFVFLICLPSLAFGQGKTIDQLSTGTTLNGGELMPMFQGTNPAVSTSITAIQTYMANNPTATTGIVAAGATFGTCKALTTSNNFVSTATTTTNGVCLPATGVYTYVFNGSTVAINVYPHTIGGQIGILGAGVAYPIAPGYGVIFVGTTGTSITQWSILGPTPDNSIDATQISASDMCAQISQAAIALNAVWPGGGLIRATGFTGVQHCAASMFANWPQAFPATAFGVMVLLGRVNLQTDVEIDIPDHVKLLGYMKGESSNTSGFSIDTGTIIQPSKAFPASTPVLTIGTFQCSGCGANEAFWNEIADVQIACIAGTTGTGSNTPGNYVTGTWGIDNVGGQEGTWIHRFETDGCSPGYFQHTVSNTPPLGSPGDAVLVSDWVIQNTGNNLTTWRCMKFGDGSLNSGEFTIGNTTVERGTCHSGINNHIIPITMIEVNGTNISFRDLHMEGTASDVSQSDVNASFMDIGGNAATGYPNAIHVDGMWCTGGSSHYLFGCLRVSSLNNGGLLVNNLYNSGPNISLFDATNGGCTIPWTSYEPGVMHYSRGYTIAGNNDHMKMLTDSSSCHVRLLTVTACGTGAAFYAPGSNDMGGQINVGSTNPTSSCTINYSVGSATANSVPFCLFEIWNNAGTYVNHTLPSFTHTSVTVSTVAAADIHGGTIDYICNYP